MPRTLAPLALLPLLVPALATAQLVLPTEPGSAAAGSPLTIRSQHVEVQVDSQVARTRVVQVFENHTDEVLEGTYVFALPDQAAVSGFATWVDGRRVESRVEEKAEAKRTYDRAAAAGAAPGLLEHLGPGAFRTRVEGIPAGGTKRTELGYSEVLPYQNGEITLRIPLRVGAFDAPTIRELRVAIGIGDRTKKLGRITSATHDIQVKHLDERHAEVVFAAKAYQPDRDLILRYQVESDELGFTFMTHRAAGEDGYFLLSIAPQELTTAADIVKKDIAFVFDTSGSMDGVKIAQARSALQQLLGLLNPGDAFTIVGFSDGMNPWKSTVVPAGSENRAEARAFADGLYAGGGTNIDAALATALEALPDRGRPRVLVFFTDGEPTMGVTNPQQILERVRLKNPHGTRIFTFGVAAGVNRHLLDELASQNRGVSEYVEPGQAIDEVVAGFYAKISKPVLSDIAFSYDPVTVALQYPRVMPDIYKGQQLLVVGRYRGEGRGKVVLTGQLNGATKTFPIPVDFPALRAEDGFVARIWARRRIESLLDQMRVSGEQSEMKDEVIRLARRYHLITPYTSMVAAPEPAMASLSPSRIKPGDPEVLVPAPADARSVTVHLPFGRTVRARWDVGRSRWVARFLIPTDVVDGVYPVRVVVVRADGTPQVLALSYTVDTRAPVMSVDLPGRVKAGELVLLRAVPRVNLMDVAGAVIAAGGTDAVETAKTFADVKHVTATLWDGREVELGIEPGQPGWWAEVETPRGLEAGTYPVAVTAVDWAGNLQRQVVDLVVVGSASDVR